MAKASAKRAESSVRTATKRKGRPQTNPNSLANLKPPFQKGTSGNPGGRPKILSESYKQWLAQINTQGITNAEAVALAMGLEAMRGDVGAAREIRAATEGDKIEQFNWDVSQLNDEQLARLADGDDIRSIIATSSASRTGTPPANQDAPGDTGP